MAIGKDDVVEVLSDFRIRGISFAAGPVNVNFNEYARVSDFVDSGAIKIKATKAVKMYDPPTNTLYLLDGDSHNDVNIRSGILHECTHVIPDINMVRITRLHDEAAAYLAQFAFLKLLNPSYENEVLLVRGNPLHDVVRVGLSLVAKYGLGQPTGFGAVISSSDIADLGKFVQRHPEYSNIKNDEQLTADGVALTDAQGAAHAMNVTARYTDKAKHENWMLNTAIAAQTGTGSQKSSAYQHLRHHFLVIYQPVATELLHRLSAVRKGDPLSERFDRFSPQEKHDLLSALRGPKPPG